jgi:cyclic beta-1,2-glucan synthetase
MSLDAMERELVDESAGIIRLLTPAFDRTPHDPGYIKGYLPGVRENGGQYTHGALWAVRALADAGREGRAAHLLEMLSPVSHSDSRDKALVYQVEPYVIAADVYGVAPHVGRGGWTWYTGSAGWMARVALESVLGVRVLDGNRVRVRPCIPQNWSGFNVRLRLPNGASIELLVVRHSAATSVTINGMPAAVTPRAIEFELSGGGAHRVELALGADYAPTYGD